jgi:hypothetical protein
MNTVIVTSEFNEEQILDVFASMTANEFIGFKMDLMVKGITPKQWWDEKRRQIYEPKKDNKS